MLQSALAPAAEPKMSVHTSQSRGLSRDTPSSHCNTNSYLLENGSMAIFGVTRITFQVLVYFNFKVLGITEAGCFGLTIM